MRCRPRSAGVILVVGAAAYSVAIGGAGVAFEATPVILGRLVFVAGLASGQVRLLPIAMVLVGWGAAVLAVHEDVVPSTRAAAAYGLGLAAGLLVAHALVRPSGRSLTGALMTAGLATLVAFLAFDVDFLARWPTWAAALAGWGLWELRTPA